MYFMHYSLLVVIILFSTGLNKFAFSSYYFAKTICSSFCLFSPVILCKMIVKPSQNCNTSYFIVFSKFIHSNTIPISKFRHFPTCGNLGFWAPFLTSWGPSYGQNIF